MSRYRPAFRPRRTARTRVPAGSAPVLPAVPVNTALPVISGTATEGETLSVPTGTWTSSPTSFAYQWRRGGAAILAATTSTYALVAADVAELISCDVTAINAGGSSAPATAAAVGPVTAAPAEPAAHYVVYNDAEFSTAHAAATAGQIIELGDGGVFGNLTLTKAVTLRGASYSHTINGAYLKDCGAAVVTRLNIQANTPPVSTPALLGISGNTGGLQVYQNRIRGGKHWDGYTDFDPSFHDEARMGSATAGWAVANSYNGLWYGIGQGADGVPNGNLYIWDNLITDVKEGVKFSWNGNGTLEIIGNRVGRCYQDCISFGIPYYGGPVTGIYVLANEGWDCFSQPQDVGNPHSDAMIQFFTDDLAPGTYNRPIPNLHICGNIYWQRPGCRGQAQRMFISDFMPGYPIVQPVIAENILLSRITSKGMEIANAGAGSVWGMITRNVIVSNPKYNSPVQNELASNTTTGIGASSSSSRANISISSDASYAVPAPVNYVSSNLSEQVAASTTMRGWQENARMGRGSAATSYAAYFDPRIAGDWDASWDTLDSAEKVYDQFRNKAKVPYDAYLTGMPDTWAGQRARWMDAAIRPYASLPSAIAWQDQYGVALGTVIQSGFARPYTGGQAPPFSGTGAEYRLADNSFGLNATTWATLPTAGSPIMLDGSKYVELRVTSGATELASSAVSISLGTYTTSWVVETLTTASFPLVNFTNVAPTDVFQPSSSISLGTDGSLLTIALLGFKMNALPAAIRTIFGLTTTAVRIQILNTNGRMRFGIGGVGTIDTSINVCDGVRHDIILTIDANQPDNISGCQLLVDGVDRMLSTSSWTTAPGPAKIVYSTAANYRFGSFDNAEIGALFIDPTRRLDATDPAERRKLNPALIGSNGQNVFGTAPHIFLTGNAAQWNNAAGQNWGTGPKFLPVASCAVADTGSGTAWG